MKSISHKGGKTKMLKIYKYGIPIDKNNFKLKMAIGAKILKVGIQFTRPWLWVLVDSKNLLIERSFHLVLTGNEIGIEVANTLDYIDTFLLDEGKSVYHLFES